MAHQVVEVAEYLDVVSDQQREDTAAPISNISQVDMITKPIESTLFAIGQVVHQSIAQGPAAWLDFAYRIRSKFIFREALIHATGQYSTPKMQTAIQDLLPKAVADVLEKRARILMNGVKMCLRNVLSYYPLHLQRARTIGLADMDNFGRNSYANDIFHWMALTVFRHYITQHVADDQTHHATDMGFALIQAISKGGDAYLDKASLTEFHRLFPISHRGGAVVENKLNDIKEEVKKFVQPLMKNQTLLQPSTPHNYFTCANVHSLDYPWIERPKRQPEDQNERELSDNYDADDEVQNGD